MTGFPHPAPGKALRDGPGPTWACQHPLPLRQPLVHGPPAPPRTGYRWRCEACGFLQSVDAEDPPPPPPAWLITACSVCLESWTVDITQPLGEYLAGALSRLHLIEAHDDPFPGLSLHLYVPQEDPDHDRT